MSSTVFFDRRNESSLTSSANPGDIFPNWKGEEERWLFLSPHDDDIICGCGLTFIAALHCGIKTFAGVVTNGKMGYCTNEERETIADVRRDERRVDLLHLLRNVEHPLGTRHLALAALDALLRSASGRDLVRVDDLHLVEVHEVDAGIAMLRILVVRRAPLDMQLAVAERTLRLDAAVMRGDDAVRKRLASWANDPDELLTVAVCFFDPDESIAASLSFPENLYYLMDRNGDIKPNGHVKILVRQEVMDGVGGVLAQGNEKFRNVRIFGMVDEGVNSGLLEDDMAIWANAVYNGIDLDKVIAGGEEGRIETEKAMTEWYGLSEEMRFSNRYQVEMYSTFEKYDRLNVPRTCLHRMEHLRWCADRYIAGYSFCPGAKQEDKEIFKVHKDLTSFDKLPEEDRNKDAEVIYNRQEIEILCTKSKKYSA